MEKKRYDNIDLLKFIAIFMVICLHVPIFSTDFMKQNDIATMIQYSFRLIFEGVLIFILVNGFLIINKPLDMKKHVRKIIKIFILLIFWGFMNVILKSLIRGEELSFEKVINNVLLIKLPHPYAGSLWFLQSLLALYILFPIIHIVHSNKKIYKYLVITIIIFSVGLNLLNIIIQLVGQLTSNPGLPEKILNNITRINPYNNAMFLLYFVLGGFIFDNKERFENKKNVLKYSIIGLIAWIIAISIGILMSKLQNKTYANNYNYNQIFLTLTIVGIYALSTLYVNKNNNSINRFIASVGKNTMGIYLIHTFVIEILNKTINIWQLGFGYRTFIAVGVFIISWILSIGIMKIPKINNILKI